MPVWSQWLVGILGVIGTIVSLMALFSYISDRYKIRISRSINDINNTISEKKKTMSDPILYKMSKINLILSDAAICMKFFNKTNKVVCVDEREFLPLSFESENECFIKRGKTFNTNVKGVEPFVNIERRLFNINSIKIKDGKKCVNSGKVETILVSWDLIKNSISYKEERISITEEYKWTIKNENLWTEDIAEICKNDLHISRKHQKVIKLRVDSLSSNSLLSNMETKIKIYIISKGKKRLDVAYLRTPREYLFINDHLLKYPHSIEKPKKFNFLKYAHFKLFIKSAKKLGMKIRVISKN